MAKADEGTTVTKIEAVVTDIYPDHHDRVRCRVFFRLRLANPAYEDPWIESHIYVADGAKMTIRELEVAAMNEAYDALSAVVALGASGLVQRMNEARRENDIEAEEVEALILAEKSTKQHRDSL